MLFNSWAFLFGFLPVVVVVAFALGRRGRLVLGWLAVSSLFFYGWSSPAHLALFLGSVVVNFSIGKAIQRSGDEAHQRRLVALGAAVNLLPLFFFKYADFVFHSVNSVTGFEIPLLRWVLPAGISFFSFTQIAWLVDCKKGDGGNYDFLRYLLFVVFFPHLIAGPIVHHTDIMPQLEDGEARRPKASNIGEGMFLLAAGLFKKVVVADTFAPLVALGWQNVDALNGLEAWTATLAYTLQLYFDFSGYSEMAVGLGLLFNVRLPQNFDSPYRSVSIQEFWRRWHMTLSRFLRDYVYIPLGGNRAGELRIARNLVITFLLGGIWHGAGWTFIVWGLIHGVAVAAHRALSPIFGRARLPRLVVVGAGWLITFAVVHVGWVFFRAPDLDAAVAMLGHLGDLEAADWDVVRKGTALSLGEDGWPVWGMVTPVGYDAFSFGAVAIGLVVVVGFGENVMMLGRRFRFSAGYAVTTGLLIVLSLLFLQRESAFLYFQF